MLVKHALDQYATDHLDLIKTGSERRIQLDRVLESYSCSDVHTITNADLTQAISRWKGGTRNRYRSALTHFWKYCRANGWTDLHPTLMGGKEQPRDQVLSLDQLRRLFHVAGSMNGAWTAYGQLLILTGQRHSDLFRFDPCKIQGRDMHVPTSKNGMPHIVPLSPRAYALCALTGLNYRDFATTAHFKRRWFRRATIPMSFQLRDIRRSMATHLCEYGENEADVDRLLNHIAAATARGVARTYNRSRRLAQRRAIVDRWELMLFPDG